MTIRPYLDLRAIARGAAISCAILWSAVASAQIDATFQGVLVGPGVISPTVTRVGAQYVMFVGQIAGGNHFDIGIATSVDGVHWTRGPTVINSANSPGWASFRESPVTLMYENGQYELWFFGNNTNLSNDPGAGNGFGRATSPDGFQWTFDPSPIRFGYSDSNGSGFQLQEVVKIGGKYHAYYIDRLATGFVMREAVSSDGINFPTDSSDTAMAVPAGYTMAAATTSSLNGTEFVFSVWTDENGVNRYAVSTDGSHLTFAGVVNLANFAIRDIRIENGVITFFGFVNVGGTPWIGYATAPLPDLTGFLSSLQVAPAAPITVSGIQGGSFSPLSFQYQLSASSGSVNFAIAGMPSWLNASFTTGTVLASQPLTVTFELTGAASTLDIGTYPSTITFTNTTNGSGNTTRTATLTVNAAPPPTELPCSPPPPSSTPPKQWMINDIERDYSSSLGDMRIIAQNADCALLAATAYLDENIVPTAGWNVVGDLEAPTGMRAMALQNQRTQEVVVAFRGTRDPLHKFPDFQTDLALCVGQNVNDLAQMQSALSFAKLYGKVTFTGHSLGGAMAQYVALKLGARAVAFDPVPLAGSYIAGELGVPTIASVNPLDPRVSTLRAQLAGYGSIANFVGLKDPVSKVAKCSAVDSQVGNLAITILNTPALPVTEYFNLVGPGPKSTFKFNHSIINLALSMKVVQIAAPFVGQ